MVCNRKTKTLVSTCVILSGMTNIICLLYVGWVTNYIATVSVKVQEPISEKKLEEDKGDTLRIIERLDHLESVIKQHIQGNSLASAVPFLSFDRSSSPFSKSLLLPTTTTPLKNNNNPKRCTGSVYLEHGCFEVTFLLP